MRARVRRALDGVLLLDKPRGITSQAAVSQVKRLTDAAKVGHTGTLDPMATGLLPLTFGEATKFSQALLEADKAYRAVLQLGVVTSTGDAEGEVLERQPVNVSPSQVLMVLQRFTGELMQTPPMFSAVKVAGKPLYTYARKGEEVERRPRRICVNALSLIDRNRDLLTIDVECTKGTYIRVLAEDIGRALGCGASLAELRRTRVGAFGVDQALGLDDLAHLSEQERAAGLWPVDALVRELPAVELEGPLAQCLMHGQSVAAIAATVGLVRVYGPGRTFLGVAEAVFGDRLVPKRLVATRARIA